MANILLIRHPMPVGRESNSPLTALGLGQAVASGRHLRGRGISRVYSSPKSRALAAAYAIATEIGIPSVTIDPQFDERTEKREGMDQDQHQYEWEESFRNRNFKPPLGLSVNEAARNHALRLRELFLSDGEKVVVGHGGGLAGLLGDKRYTRPIPEEIRRIPEIGIDGLDLAMPKSSITEITMKEDMFYVVGKLGSTEHLEQDSLREGPGRRK